MPTARAPFQVGGMAWVQCVACARRRLPEDHPLAARCELPGCDKTIERDTERDPDDGEEG